MRLTITEKNYNDVENLMKNEITHLCWGLNEIFPTEKIPISVTHLIFGTIFNLPVIIPNSITHLTFGYLFNQRVDIPDSVIHLTFGKAYNQPTQFPNNLKYLHFEHDSEYMMPSEIPPSVISHNLKKKYIYVRKNKK
jgi:hypothetical protein